MGRSTRVVLASVAGAAGTLVFYALLAILQFANADNACESVPQGAGYADVRGIGFENSWLNLGGSCTYHMTDGSVVRTLEPGLWLSGTIAAFVAFLASVAVLIARRDGRPGLPFGLITLVAPPLGLALAMTRRSVP